MREYRILARANLFKVKDIAAFSLWASTREMEVVTHARNGEIYCTIRNDINRQGWERKIYDEDAHDRVDTNFEEELAMHLQDRSVAVLVEVGSDQVGRFGGNASAINSKGEIVRVDLNQIYGKASHLGDDITRVPGHVWGSRDN